MREYDIKQWEKTGKEGKMMRKTMEKRRDFDIKEWKKNGTAMETVERIGREQWEKMRKERKMMRKTMEKRRAFDIKQWKKMGKQWKRKEQGEGQMMSGMKGKNDVE